MSTDRSRTQSSSPFVLPEERTYLAVGVTGGIGSGKTALCEAFAAAGRSVFSADVLARNLTENDPGILGEIRSAFGANILTPAGGVDRQALAAIVFHDRGARERLNAIVHPRVFRALTEILKATDQHRLEPYTILEAALIYETGMDRGLDYVIVVDAPEEERIQRVTRRDGISRDAVVARIASQMSAHEKRIRADFVVENTSQPDALRNHANFLDGLLRIMARRG